MPAAGTAAADTDEPVLFAAGSARIDAAALAVLRQHVLRLREAAKLVVTLVGYADPAGSPSYNLALAEARLDSVAAALRSLGVAKHRIRRSNAGFRPFSRGCKGSACRSPARRVELVYAP